MTPYSTGVVAKKRRGGGAASDDLDLLEEGGETVENEGEVENEDDIETDTMIKVITFHRKCREGSILGCKLPITLSLMVY